ncbi:MAG: NfeD family protein [Candidatus Brocadiia bacterium]
MKKILAVLFLMLLVGLPVAWSAPDNAPASPTNTSSVKQLVYVIPIKGAIMDWGLNYFVKRSIETAKSNNAALIIFDIDTPGGRVDISIELCNIIENAAPITTVAYVDKWAVSAGSLISIAADKIIMKDGAIIGSAEVVGAPVGHEEKYASVMRTEFKARAQKKGYPHNLMMAMVDKDMEVFEVKVDGKRDFLTRDEIKNLSMQGKEVAEIGLVIGKGKLLNLTARDALNYGLATAIKDNRDEIPALFDIKSFKITEASQTWSEYLVAFLADQTVTLILVAVGLIAGYSAFQMPGTGLLEAIAVLCFGIIFFSQYLVGLAQVTEILLFILGIGLIGVEIFLLPGFGVAGISGAILIFVSLILSMQNFTLPDIEKAPWQWTILQHNFVTVGAALIISIVILIIIARFLPSMPIFNRMILPTALATPAGITVSGIDAGTLVGNKGIVLTDLRPSGKIRLDNSEETLDVVTDGDFINKGESVVIDAVEGSRIVVRKA